VAVYELTVVVPDTYSAENILIGDCAHTCVQKQVIRVHIDKPRNMVFCLGFGQIEMENYHLKSNNESERH